MKKIAILLTLILLTLFDVFSQFNIEQLFRSNTESTNWSIEDEILDDFIKTNIEMSEETQLSNTCQTKIVLTSTDCIVNAYLFNEGIILETLYNNHQINKLIWWLFTDYDIQYCLYLVNEYIRNIKNN